MSVVCQMDRLLDYVLRNVLMKWKSADCPYYKFLLASARKIENRRKDASSMTKGLNDADLEAEGRYLFLHALFAVLTQLLLNYSLQIRNLAPMIRVLSRETKQ